MICRNVRNSFVLVAPFSYYFSLYRLVMPPIMMPNFKINIAIRNKILLNSMILSKVQTIAVRNFVICINLQAHKFLTFQCALLRIVFDALLSNISLIFYSIKKTKLLYEY